MACLLEMHNFVNKYKTSCKTNHSYLFRSIAIGLKTIEENLLVYVKMFLVLPYPFFCTLHWFLHLLKFRVWKYQIKTCMRWKAIFRIICVFGGGAIILFMHKELFLYSRTRHERDN